MNNETDKPQSKPQGLKNANLQILRRVDWEKGTHPRLHELLQMLHSAPDIPGEPAPIIEIAFAGEHFYLVSECVGDFASRLYGDFRDRRPPFTGETLEKCVEYICNQPDNIKLVVDILYGNGEPDEPGAEG